MGKNNKSENDILDHLFRGAALVIGAATASWNTPPIWHIALLTATHIHADGLVVALNDTVWKLTAKGIRLYKVTAGAGALGTGTAYPGVKSEVIVDGAATLTEQYTEMESGAAFVEPASADYARKAITASLTNFNSTQGDNLASTGTDGTIENSVPVDYPDALTAGYGKVGAFAMYDASVAGSSRRYGYLPAAVDIGVGVSGIVFAAGAMAITEDS